MRVPVVVTAALVLVAALVACSEDPPSGSSSSSGGSSGAVDAGELGTDAGGVEEDSGETADAAPTPANKTSLVATINDVTRTLDIAQFGVTLADDTLYVEVNEGGVPECPEDTTPKRKVIVSGVPKGAPGTKATKADDGVSVALLDFTGDQIKTDNPNTIATAATVTIVSIADGETVEIDVEATFPEGTVKGRVHATYCASLDD